MEPASPEGKEVDFFSEHTKDEPREEIVAEQKLSAPQPVKNGALSGAHGRYQRTYQGFPTRMVYLRHDI